MLYTLFPRNPRKWKTISNATKERKKTVTGWTYEEASDWMFRKTACWELTGRQEDQATEKAVLEEQWLAY